MVSKPKSLKRALAALGLILLTSLALAAGASANTITTSGHNLKMSSSKLEFKIGSVAINCQKAEATGVIGTPSADTVALSNPLIQGSEGAACSTVGMSGATFNVVTGGEGEKVWKLKDNSESSGSLIPPAYGFGIRFVMTGGGCEILEKDGAITGVWTNGSAKTPSALTLVGAPFFVTPLVWSGCPTALVNELTKEKQTVKMTATFSVTDTTAPETPVLFS